MYDTPMVLYMVLLPMSSYTYQLSCAAGSSRCLLCLVSLLTWNGEIQQQQQQINLECTVSFDAIARYLRIDYILLFSQLASGCWKDFLTGSRGLVVPSFKVWDGKKAYSRWCITWEKVWTWWLESTWTPPLARAPLQLCVSLSGINNGR